MMEITIILLIAAIAMFAITAVQRKKPLPLVFGSTVLAALALFQVMADDSVESLLVTMLVPLTLFFMNTALLFDVYQSKGGYRWQAGVRPI